MTFTLFGRRVESGESTVLDIKVAEYPDGTPIGLKIRAAVGAREGPRVVVARAVIFDTRYQPTVYPGDWTYHCGRLT